jgi:hypothetical protein
MQFNDKFLEKIENNPINSIVEIVEIINANLEDNDFEWNEKDYEILFEGFSLIQSIIESFEISVYISVPNINGETNKDCMLMYDYINNIGKIFQAKSTAIRLDAMKNKFKRTLNQSFAYEFSQGDLDRIQVLINELRHHINSSDLFEEEHKSRLLSKLEKLQAEMHKKMSDIDKFWGLIGDAGVMLGKFGKDSKPLVDRIKEISDIVWRTQARAEELPSSTPTPLIK